jgi:ankyrin repeat protein
MADHGNKTMVKLQLPTGMAALIARSKLQLWTPLHIAARDGYVDIVRFLLETGKAIIDGTNWYGDTPLSTAAVHGHTAIVELLLQTGKAGLNYENCAGLSPLSLAKAYGHQVVVELLRSYWVIE